MVFCPGFFPRKLEKKGFFQSNNTEIQRFYDRHSPQVIENKSLIVGNVSTFLIIKVLPIIEISGLFRFGKSPICHQS